MGAVHNLQTLVGGRRDFTETANMAQVTSTGDVATICQITNNNVTAGLSSHTHVWAGAVAVAPNVKHSYNGRCDV